jgi:SHS2 domain-containing protein
VIGTPQRRADMRSEPAGPHEMINGFEIVDHTADWALRVKGSDLVNLFKFAAIGMSTLMVDKQEKIQLTVEREIVLEAFDTETLLVDWLNELAYFAEDEQLIFSEFHIEALSRNHLAAHIRGGRVSQLQKHIKAVTFHNLSIDETESGLTATVVFDV